MYPVGFLQGIAKAWFHESYIFMIVDLVTTGRVELAAMESQALSERGLNG